MNHQTSRLAYVGCRTTRERNARGRGLAVFQMGESRWKLLQLVEGLRNPSFLCTHPTLPMLYAVHGDFAELTSFQIGVDGKITTRQQLSTWGRNPVHLTFTPSARWLLVVNYATGSLVSMRVASDGTLGQVAHSLSFKGACGPDVQQDGSHPHQICYSPDNRYAFIPDKGLDTVHAVQVDEDTGALALARETHFAPGTGPRHMTFHPRLPIAYVVGELDRTVMTLHCEGARLLPFETRSTVPVGVHSGSAAGIVLSADARTLYVSNRGHDSVAVYPVSEEGSIGQPQWVLAGKTPRFICQTPRGDGLVVACEDGDSIATLQTARDARPAFNTVAETGSPVCVVFRKAIR